MTHADRERQLLKIAEQVLVERGYAATTMDEIARRAGVTKPLLYRHFGSKDGLTLACIARVRAELFRRWEQAIVRAPTLHEKFRLGIHSFFDYIAQHERAWSILLAEGVLTGPAGDEVEALRGQQADLVARLLAEKPGVRETVRLDTYAQAVVGACERVALWRRLRSDPDADEAARHLADLFWFGLEELTRDGSR
jgi:AcrR family transcriptional regulator